MVVPPMNSPAELRKIDDAYERFRGLFFHAAGELAARGFIIPPDEVLDLIHDFFLEEWVGLSERFDPNKSRFSTYVYAAFVRFARRRSIILRRFRNGLRDSKDIARLIDESEYVDSDPARKHDIAVVADALAKLPSLQRELIVRYLDSLETSERVLAAEYSLSRYKVRALLVEAFGATAAALGVLEIASKHDWDVGVAVWKEGRSIEDAAVALGISPTQARAAQKRNRRAIAVSITAFHGNRKIISRSTFMAESSRGVALWMNLVSSRNHSALAMAREHARELVEVLDMSEQRENLNLENIDPRWLAAIYSSIAEGLGIDEAVTGSVDPLYEAYVEQQADVGRAFHDVLVAEIPDAMAELINALSGLQPVNKEIQALLREEPDVKQGQPESEQLLPYGITPMTLLHTTDAMAMLLKRAIRRGVFRKNVPVILSAEDGATSLGGEGLLKPGVLAHEIAIIAKCQDDVATVLFPWMIHAASLLPYLLAGFEAKPVGYRRKVELKRIETEYRNLYQRCHKGSR